MSGRHLLIPVALLSLIAVVGPGPRSGERPPAAKPTASDRTTPIVAVRGEPLAEFEEPLPPGARVRIGSTRFRRPKHVHPRDAHVAGPYFVSRDGETLTLTDVATGRRVWDQPVRWGEGERGSFSVAASADGRLVVWSYGPLCKDRSIGQVWRVRSDPARPLRLATVLRLPDGFKTDFIDSIFFPPDASEVWVLAHDGVHAFDAESGLHHRHVRTKHGILAMDRRGTRLLTSSEHDPRSDVLFRSGSFRWPRYRFASSTSAGPRACPKRPLGRLQRPVTQEAVTDPLTLMVLDARTGDEILAFTIPRLLGRAVPHLDLSSDGRYLSYEADSCLMVFDIDQARQVLELDTWEGDAKESRQQITESWFSDDEARFTVAGPDIGEIQFDLTTGSEVAVRGEKPMKGGYLCRVSRTAAVSEQGAFRRPGNEPLPPGYAGVVLGCSADQRLVAVGDGAGRLDVRDPDGRLVKALGTGGAGIAAVAFSPDGRRVAGCDQRRVVRVWVVGSWRECDRFEVPVSGDLDDLCPQHLVFSPDGRRLLVARGDVLALWDFDGRTWVWDVPGRDPWSRSAPPAFLPDGSGILCHGARCWLDTRTGIAGVPLPDIEVIPSGLSAFRWDADRDEAAIALSPGGARIAVIDHGGLIQVSDTAAGSRFRPFPESGSVRKRHGLLRFSPDGRRLVTCDDAGHAHVWEVATGQLAFTLAYPDGAIQDVYFGRDGRSLVTANHREVIVWDLPAEPGASADPWADLAHEAPRAEQARRALLADPTGAVTLMRERLRPAEPLDAADVRRLIQSLDADDYRNRHRAAAGLLAAGRRVLPWSDEAKPASGEGTARLAAVVRDLSAGLTPGERREVRAVEVLEQVGTPAARALIARLATGDPAAVLTEEAGKSVRALNRTVGPGTGPPARLSLSGPARITATTAQSSATGSIALTTTRGGTGIAVRTTD